MRRDGFCDTRKRMDAEGCAFQASASVAPARTSPPAFHPPPLSDAARHLRRPSGTKALREHESSCDARKGIRDCFALNGCGRWRELLSVRLKKAFATVIAQLFTKPWRKSLLFRSKKGRSIFVHRENFRVGLPLSCPPAGRVVSRRRVASGRGGKRQLAGPRLRSQAPQGVPSRRFSCGKQKNGFPGAGSSLPPAPGFILRREFSERRKTTWKSNTAWCPSETDSPTSR